MPQAAIYARVSSERQKEEQTIDSQIAAVLQYAQQHAYPEKCVNAAPTTWDRSVSLD